MYVKSGSYLGTGSAHTESPAALSGVDLTGANVLLLIKGGANVAVFTTDRMGADATKDLVGATALFSGAITALGNGSFSVGTDAKVNSNGVCYNWLAFVDDGNLDFETGSYTGNNTDNTNISLATITASPNMVWIASASTERTHLKTSDAAGDAAMVFGGTVNGLLNNIIQSFSAGQFQIGNRAGTVNTTATTYYYAAWVNAANLFKVLTYNGDGTDPRNITGAGFDPDGAFTKRNSGTTGAMRFKDEVGDNSYLVDATGEAANRIQNRITDGFEVGSDTAVNAAAANQYLAFVWIDTVTVTNINLAGNQPAASGALAPLRVVSLAGNQPADSGALAAVTIPNINLAGNQPAASGGLVPLILTPVYTTWVDLERELDPADWDGTVAAYLEVHGKTGDAGFALKARVYNVTLASPVAGSDISDNPTSETRIRSGAFSLDAGPNSYRVEFGGLVGATYTLYDAVLILEVTP